MVINVLYRANLLVTPDLWYTYHQVRTMKYPKVSVVIPAFNEEKFIGKTLESLQHQDYPGVFEIIVVDNASTDNTAAIAKQYGAKVVYQPIKGLQYTRQRGFEEATGEFIASTDADDLLPTNWLTRLATELLTHKEYVAVGGWFKLAKGPIIPRFYVNHLSTPTLAFYSAFTRKPILQDQNYMVRKTAFDKVGGYKGLDAMNEDLMLAHRLSKVGRVKFFFGMRWAVVTSPRRWNNGFVLGGIHYFINAASWALFRKLPIKDFSDIREEEHRAFAIRHPLNVVLAIALTVGALLVTPTPTVQAKVLPVTRKAQQELASNLHKVTKPLSTKTAVLKQKIPQTIQAKLDSFE